WWFAKTSLADHRDEAIKPIKMALAASANHAFRFTLEGKGVPPDLHERIRALQREYNAHHHELPGAANASLPDRWGLTEFLVDRFAIAGTPGDCIAQIQRAMAAGARPFIITGFVPDPTALLRRWAREVAGRLWFALFTSAAGSVGGGGGGGGGRSGCVTHSPESQPSGLRTGFGGPTPPERPLPPTPPAPIARAA